MISVLFARQESIYKTMNVDVWDIERDARTYMGADPVIAHPPCRAWGRLRGMAKPRPDEKALAIFALQVVRKNGGVLEHPAWSALWSTMQLPAPGKPPDEFGGWTLPVVQFWWGHRAMKHTWLYIVGVLPTQIPVMPMALGNAPCIIGTSGRRKNGSRREKRPEVSKAEREETPQNFALWLIDLAGRCERNGRK
jgi:hypothetical protein